MDIETELQQHYRLLLGLPTAEPTWLVDNVNLCVEAQNITIDLSWPKRTRAFCPTCGAKCPVHDRQAERTWRHLDIMQFTTYIKCRLPRTHCPEHGVKTVKTPWAEPDRRFTLLFEKFALSVLRECRNIQGASRLLQLSWDELHLIMTKAVDRGLARRDTAEAEKIGVDEKGFGKGQNYVSVLTDIDGGRVIDVVEGRDKEASGELFDKLGENKEKVVAVAMDMWEPYRLAAVDKFDNAVIVHDKFHISGYLNKSVDSVRKMEHKILLKAGIGSLYRTKYLWLKGEWTDENRALYASIKNICVKTSRAWAIKENFKDFWDNVNSEYGVKFFNKWYYWATHSRLKPVIKVAKMLKRHLNEILNYFKYRISNANAESMNDKIQQIKYNGRGYKNFKNFRMAILFYCGKLELFP